MKDVLFPLSLVTPGEEVILVSIQGGKGLKMRLTDMGLNEGMKVKVIHSHHPGPCIVMVGNTRLVLGRGMANKILVKDILEKEK